MKHVARLTYNAASEILSGAIGKEHFNEVAYSGGGRGHKANVSAAKSARYLHDRPVQSSLGKLATTREIYDKKTDTYQQRGGTIPPGPYRCRYIARHPSFGECVYLEPMEDARAIRSPFASVPIVHHRGGFFIHGQGPKGSDGCLVPAHESRRRVLNKAIKNFGGSVILEVTHASYMLPAERGLTGTERFA